MPKQSDLAFGHKRLALILKSLDTDSLTLIELSEAREVLRLAVQNLEQTDVCIAEMRETLRDKFAAAALTGLLASNNMRVDDMSARAFQISDSMLASRSGPSS